MGEMASIYPQYVPLATSVLVMNSASFVRLLPRFGNHDDLYFSLFWASEAYFSGTWVYCSWLLSGVFCYRFKLRSIYSCCAFSPLMYTSSWPYANVIIQTFEYVAAALRLEGNCLGNLREAGL